MRGRPEPRGFVERAGANPADHLLRRCARLRTAGEPATAFGTNPSCHNTTAICGFLQEPRLAFHQTKRTVRYRYREREGAAGQALTIGAVAGIGHQRHFADLIPQRAAQAAAVRGSCIAPVLLAQPGTPSILPLRFEAERMLAVHRADRVPVQTDMPRDGIDVPPGALHRVR